MQKPAAATTKPTRQKKKEEPTVEMEQLDENTVQPESSSEETAPDSSSRQRTPKVLKKLAEADAARNYAAGMALSSLAIPTVGLASEPSGMGGCGGHPTELT